MVPRSDDPEDRDPGLAEERTRLAWVRTAISFAAVGVALLKVDVPLGVTVLAMVPFIWLAGRRMTWHSPHGENRPRLLLLMALGVAAIGVVVLVLVLTRGNSPGFHPPHG
jgi:uncharacterized membrane protein YidH (DUF202 family)